VWLVLISLNLDIFHSNDEKINSKVVEIQYLSQEDLKQIVEQDEQSINEEKPDKAKFLSVENQKINEQTKAVNNGQFNNQIQIARPAKRISKQNKEQLPSLADLQPDSGWFTEEEKQSQAETNSTDTRLARNSDYLQDIKEGAQTILNTREFKYYSYYSRIRHQLQQYWEPSIKDKFTALIKRGRAIASTEDRITRVLITLNPAGNLMKIQLLEESGLRDLDDAAIEAFQDAAPFPNPPAGIIDIDGTVKIRWDFVVEA